MPEKKEFRKLKRLFQLGLSSNKFQKKLEYIYCLKATTTK